jgi:hypothetical protein
MIDPIAVKRDLLVIRMTGSMIIVMGMINLIAIAEREWSRVWTLKVF